MVLSRLLGPQECQICQQAHFLTWRSMSLMLQEAIQPTAHLQLSCPRPLISLYVSIWAFPLDIWYPHPPFRACTGSGNAGGYNAPGIPNITGAWSGWNIMSIEGGGPSGAFQSHWEPNGTVALETKTAGVWDNLIIDASNSNPVYGSSQTVMPASIDVPCIIYLGIST